MPKYIIIGLGIPLLIVFSMSLWSKLNENTKNKVITAIFAFIAIIFVAILVLLFV